MKRVECRPNGQSPGLIPRAAVMRGVIVLAVAFAIALIAGCSHHGDFGAFFIQKVIEFGGQPKATGNLPPLDAKWSYDAEKNKFRVLVKGQPFSSVEAWLQQALGPPRLSVNAGPQARPNRVWVAADIGVAVHCVDKAEGVEIICVRGSGGK